MKWRIIGSVLLLILAIATAWYFFSMQKPAVAAEFSKDGNIIKDNPGFEHGIWYLSYEIPGASGLAKKLVFDAQSLCGTSSNLTSCDISFSQGQRVHVEGLETDDSIKVRTLTTATSSDTGIQISLYYYNPDLDQGPGGAQCSSKGLVEVSRQLPGTSTPLKDSIKLLLRGELSDEEKAQGVTSEFPLTGVSLMSATIDNGVAMLTFSDPLSKTGGGSCRVSILRLEIEATAKQFSSVKSVKILPEELFQP